MKKILIVEDELIVARDIRRTLERNGHEVAGVAQTAENALAQIKELRPWLVLVDIFLKGDLTGIDLAKQLNREGIPFIYISANSNQPVLEAAKPTNPYGFIVKPFRERDLLVTIDIAKYRHENSLQMSFSGSRAEHVPDVPDGAKSRRRVNSTGNGLCGNMIGDSAAITEVLELISQVAPFDTSVLLLGESGTGKELAANCIFQQSMRNNKPFVKVNCAAIPSTLMEAEFFGYEKGAFTGAVSRRAGKFEMASGGTIFLDEIGDMSIDMQVKLMRTLQEKEIQRIGSNANLKIDVRVIAATSKNLEQEVSNGRFRLDLYYRLHVFPITLPPLRQRKEDLPALARHFILRLVQKSGKEISGISKDALQAMMLYDWPGNIRELEHVIERSFLMTRGTTLEDVDLSLKEDRSKSQATDTEIKSFKEYERELILGVLEKTNGRIGGPGGAAELLKMPPTTLHSKMKKLGIKWSY